MSQEEEGAGCGTSSPETESLEDGLEDDEAPSGIPRVASAPTETSNHNSAASPQPESCRDRTDPLSRGDKLVRQVTLSKAKLKENGVLLTNVSHTAIKTATLPPGSTDALDSKLSLLVRSSRHHAGK